MRLSDIMSQMNLSVYPQVALVIFLLVFASVVWRVYRKRSEPEFARHASLPLEESPIVEPSSVAPKNKRTTT